MNEQSFFDRRRPDWVRLMQLCDKADISPVDLSPPEIKELVQLYRRVSTDLAFVRTVSTNPGLINYLNDLAARAYSVVYRQPRSSLGKVVGNAVAAAAITVRRRFAFVFTSFLLFFGSAFLAFGLSGSNIDVENYFVPPAFRSVFDTWKTGKFEEHTTSESAMMSGLYASNNPRIAIIAGAVGAGTFGLVSIFLVADNGAILGVLGHEMASVGKLGFLIASISPHGVPELSGIIISGSAGLLLGWSLIVPGRRTRADSLRSVGKDAVTLLATSVVMMFIAAPIEGFFSFNPKIPSWAKAIVATVSVVAWAIFWSSYGKNRPAPAIDHSPVSPALSS